MLVTLKYQAFWIKWKTTLTLDCDLAHADHAPCCYDCLRICYNISERTLPSASCLICRAWAWVCCRRLGCWPFGHSPIMLSFCTQHWWKCSQGTGNYQWHTHNGVFQTKSFSGSNTCVSILALAIQSSNIKSRRRILTHSNSALSHSTAPPTHRARHGPFITNR